MVVKVVLALVFLSFSNAQLSITGSDGRNYTIQGQRYGINCTVPATLDTSIVLLKGVERVCSLLMESCPILPSDRFPCGCSVKASGDRILYHMTEQATVKGFDDMWLCKEFNSSKMAVSLDVSVFSGPDNIRLNSSSQVVVSNGGSAQAVQCSADCNPPCSYFWYKGSPDTAPMVFGHRVLLADILQKQPPGSQVYTCVAINRMKPVNNNQTILLEVIVEPLPRPDADAVAPRINFGQSVSETNLSVSKPTSRPLPTNTIGLTRITADSANSNQINLTLPLTPPTTQQITTIQSTSTTTVTTVTTPTTAVSTTTMLTSTTTEPTLQESDTQTPIITGIIVTVVLVLIVLVVVAIIVVLIIYKRGKRQSRIVRTIAKAPSNPIYANNPDIMGVTPNFQGTILIRNDEYMNYSQGRGDQYGVQSPTYLNTTQPSMYTSLDKEQLRNQPSNTYEQLGGSQTVNPQHSTYTLLENQQKHVSSEENQGNLSLPGSPVYMNTGSGSSLLGNNKDSDLTKIDDNDVAEEPVSLEYMNLNVSKK